MRLHYAVCTDLRTTLFDSSMEVELKFVTDIHRDGLDHGVHDLLERFPFL